MSPQECIAALDRALAVAGEDVILRRVSGAAGSQVNLDVAARASVRAYRPEQLVGGIAQTDSQVIMSPTEIAREQWPGGETGVNPSVPRINDKLIIAGRVRNIVFVNPISMPPAVLVRIEMRVSG